VGRSNTTKRGPLPSPDVQLSETTLTRYAGAVPLLRYLNEVLELPQRLLQAVPAEGRARKHPVHLVLYAFLVGSLLGIEKLAHLEWLRGDSVVEKFLRLAAWPVRKVFSEALASVSDAGVAALSKLLTWLGLLAVRGQSSAVLDFDSTALVCFGTQEGAQFGYCGKGRNRRRHHPLVASVADPRAVVHAVYRDGSGIDEKEAIAFMKEAYARLREKVTGTISMRADAGFWSKGMGNWLLEQGIPFAFAMPLLASLKLLLMNVTFSVVAEDDEDIEIGVLGGEAMGYDARLRIVVIRRRVHDGSAPPPGKEVGWDPEWRYQAVVTNLDWEPVDVWRFYNDRGDAERVFKTGKHALGLGWLVGQALRANTVAFLLRLIAYNADLLFHQHAEQQARTAGRPVRRIGLQARQHYFYQLAGRLLRVHNRWVLRLPANEQVADMWAFYDPAAAVT
jgi:hypothetical protein